MARNASVNHPIKLHIIDYLTHQKEARFAELRPPRIDTNLFSYHLNGLIKTGVVDKLETGYALHIAGLSRWDSQNMQAVSAGGATSRPQKLASVNIFLVVQNGDGDILLQRRKAQPFIDSWSLPFGVLSTADGTVEQAARRIAGEVLGLARQDVERAGDCYIRQYLGDELVDVSFAHVFRFYRDDIQTGDDVIWARPHKLNQLELAPGVEDIMTRTFFKDPFFFEEFTVDLA